jgi:putative acetyltransferase
MNPPSRRQRPRSQLDESESPNYGEADDRNGRAASALAAGDVAVAMRDTRARIRQQRGRRVMRENRALGTAWTTRPETGADAAAIREVNLAAFPSEEEADLVDELRASEAWIDGLSIVADDPEGTVVAHALLSRCHVDGVPALALAPCAVLPRVQRTGAGSAAIRAALEAAQALGENLVVVLGHADYYRRFGFVKASGFGIHVNFQVPDEALMALALDPSAETPSGTVAYPGPFGV